MNSKNFGVEEIVEADRAYEGSRFADVRDAMFANPYQKIWGGAGEPPMPRYEATLSGVLRGAFRLGRAQFVQASRRAVNSHADLRWGPDRQGYRRLLHPNGVCLTGLWEITENSGYTGYFGKEQPGLGRQPLFHLLLRDASRRNSILVARWEAVSDHRPQSRPAAPAGEFFHPGRHWRRRHALRQRRGASQLAKRHALAVRQRHADHNNRGNRLYPRR